MRYEVLIGSDISNIVIPFIWYDEAVFLCEHTKGDEVYLLEYADDGTDPVMGWWYNDGKTNTIGKADTKADTIELDNSH
jgi:hypothetical protein